MIDMQSSMDCGADETLPKIKWQISRVLLSTFVLITSD